jgi:hypothetical protein
MNLLLKKSWLKQESWILFEAKKLANIHWCKWDSFVPRLWQNGD